MPAEVYEHPATPFVFGFLGAVNQLPGERVGFVRPHDVDIVAPGAGRLDARVDRVLAFGAIARVELLGAGGEHYEVEIGRHEADTLALQPGQPVGLAPRKLTTFDGAPA